MGDSAANGGVDNRPNYTIANQSQKRKQISKASENRFEQKTGNLGRLTWSNVKQASQRVASQFYTKTTVTTLSLDAHQSPKMQKASV